MILSNFIRRNAKRKGSKVDGSRGHQQTPSTSSVGSSLVLDIKEGPSSVSGPQASPLVELDLSGPNEAWFPKELLQPHNDLTQKSHVDPPSAEFTRNTPVNVAVRKKSIPAPILITGASFRIPDIQIGQSTVSAGTPSPQLNPDTVATKEPSPSASENLSSISGTTLARALIASSFMLSPNERRSSQRRSSVPRQDSATLPCGDVIFLSSQAKSSMLPVPSASEKIIGIPSGLSRPFTINSGASTESEYPMSDSYITSPEIGSAKPQRIFSAQGTPSSMGSASLESHGRVDFALAHKYGIKKGVFDVPKTATEVPLPINAQEVTSQQEGLTSVSREAHSLDEFDFVPPESLVAFASPDSESSASYTSPLPKRNGLLRVQRKRRIGGLNLGNASKVNGQVEGHECHSTSSMAMSEHDYGELLHYDLTVSPGSCSSSHGLSSTSAGYQTFPETPMVFSPLGSPAYTCLAKSDGMLGRASRSPKYPRIGLGKPFSSVRVIKQKVGVDDGADNPTSLNRSQSSSLPRGKTPPLRLAESNLSPSLQENDELRKTGEKTQYSASKCTELPSFPLEHQNTESFGTLVRRSSLPSPSINANHVDRLPDLTTVEANDPSTSIPLPESTDASPSISPVPTGSVAAPSPLINSPQSSLPSSNTAISQSQPLKSSLSLPSSSLGCSSFPRSPLSPVLFDGTCSPLVSPEIIFSDASSEVVSHSCPLSFLPPPPYHAVVSGTSHLPGPISTSSISQTSSTSPGFRHLRQASDSSVASGITKTRVRARPPLPIGPRRPGEPGHASDPFVPGIYDRGGFASPFGISGGRPKSVWRKLQSAASKSPKFQTPPPKWRGMTLEVAHWTFTSPQLQEIVSQAIQQSAEGSSLRLMRLETLEGKVADEVHRLELQHTDVKAQYKALVRKRWMLMGSLVSHMEGVETNYNMTASRTVQELTEVLVALDQLAEKMHETVLQLAQLKSLREVHNASALAMVVRKINNLFVRQTAEKERLVEQVRALQTERDEAWKQAENIAQDYDTLNELVRGNLEDGSDVVIDPNANTDLTDIQYLATKRRSARISAVRKSTVRLSQAGLWPRSRLRASPFRPASLALDIPHIPSLLVNRSPLSPVAGSAASFVDTGITVDSVYSSMRGASVAWEFAEAQREVYGMLGLSIPPNSRASFTFRRRTISDTEEPVRSSAARSSRPTSELLDGYVQPRGDRGRATRSLLLNNSLDSVVAPYGRIATPF